MQNTQTELQPRVSNLLALLGFCRQEGIKGLEQLQLFLTVANNPGFTLTSTPGNGVRRAEYARLYSAKKRLMDPQFGTDEQCVALIQESSEEPRPGSPKPLWLTETGHALYDAIQVYLD